MGDIAEIYGGEGVDVREAQEDTGDYSPIPPGWYPAMIEAARVKTTTAGNGKYLEVTMSVLGESHAGRKVFSRLNLMNPNAVAVEIGRRELASLGKACGLSSVTATAELVDKSIEVRLKIKKGTNGYGDSNEVSRYAASGSRSPAAAKPSPQPSMAAQPQAQGPSKRPWENSPWTK